MAKFVVGMFEDLMDARRAVEELVQNGFSRENISLVAQDAEGRYADTINKSEADSEELEDVGKSAVEGAGIGAVLGGMGGLLLGLAGLAIPGIGPIIAAGPIVAALAGAGVGAAAGGLVGGLVEAGVSDEQAHKYAEAVRRGGTLVTVHSSDERAQEAVNILNRHNPVDVDRRAEQWRQENWQTFDAQSEPYTSDMIERERSAYPRSDREERDHETFEVVEEEMRVGKREVSTGGVRVHSYVTEKPVEETVDLRREHIDVDRRRVDRPASDADFDTFQEGEIEFTETSEEVVANKRARVVEEVEVTKDAEYTQETVRDTLRRKDVEIENIDSEQWSEYEPVFRSHFDTTYTHTGRTYDEYEPAYQYGYTLASDQRYRDRDWNDFEMEARRDWERRYQDSAWDDVKDAVRQAWLKVTGRA